MTIHKEGYKMLFWTVLILALVNGIVIYFIPSIPYLKNGILAISVVFFLIILQFFRSPSRTVPYSGKHIIAPADGKVVVIEEVEETEYFKEKRLQVSIFMSPINVHVNRYPISGRVVFLKYHPGLFLVAWHPKSSTENERTTVVIETPGKVAILMRQIAGALAKRIVLYSKQDEVVKQGDELGFIKFGSRVDLFLPLDTKLNIKLNQKVRGGETVLAELSS
jgi:phosphatidylserine decarboxylase